MERDPILDNNDEPVPVKVVKTSKASSPCLIIITIAMI